MKRLVGTWLVVALLGGCGGDEEEPATVMDALVAQEYLSLAPGAIMAPYVTYCGQMNPDYDPETYSEWADTYCSVAETLRFYREDGDYYMQLSFYLYDLGEARDVDGPFYDSYGRWMEDGAFYCSFTMRFDPRPVEGFPESDVQELPYVITDVSERCLPGAGPGDGIRIGAEAVTRMYRSTRPDVYFEQLPEDGVSFRGVLGMPDTGGVGPDTVGDPGVGWAWAYQACTPEPTAEGPGICTPRCRLFAPGAGLEMCSWEDLMALPANPDVIDDDWRAANADLYDEVHGP